MSTQTLKVALSLALLVAASWVAVPAVAQGATQSEAVMIDLATFTAVGNSVLVRNNTGLNFEVSAGGLNPNEAYSMWCLLFGPDGGDGLTVFNCGGGLADDEGNLTVAGNTKEGVYTFPLDADGNPDPYENVLFEGEFADSRAPFVSFVFVNHGPKITGSVNDQTSTRYFGCGNDPRLPAPDPSLPTCVNTYQTFFHSP